MPLTSLRKTPLLRTLPEPAVQEVATRGALRRFRKGEVVFREGQPAEAVWIVLRGWVTLRKRAPHGDPVTLFTMTPNEALCGISAFDQGNYSATAVAATDAHLLGVPREVIESLLTRYPAFAKAILLTCCQRIRHMADAISIAQAPVAERLAYTLLRLRDSFGNTIPVTHQELAGMAGTRWETSIRTLAAMRRKGWVASARGRITLLAPRRLHAVLHNGTA
jgi:CRP/FNR family transcriptional regulator